MQREKEPAGGLTSASLRTLALAAMLLDHIGAVLVEYGLFYQGGTEAFRRILDSSWAPFLYEGGRLLRMVGRIAFPLFCFLLVEGFFHTRSRRRYLGRLLSFALLSEIPFDLAVANRVLEFGYQNVFFELAACLLVLMGLERAQWAREETGRMSLQLAAAAGGCLLVLLLRADYGAVGIAFVVLYYYARGNRRLQVLGAGILGFLESLSVTYGAGVLAAVPIFFYNGRKGRAPGHCLLYWFYPLHLLVLFGLRWGLLGIAPQL